MRTRIGNYIEQHQALIDQSLQTSLPLSKLAGAEKLNEAISYAVLSRGKRMRPVLTLLAAEVCGAPAAAALPVASAVEFLHAASLVIDDLPCMDDARLRRGNASLHRLYGSDVAILAALALMNEAYALFAEVPGLLPGAVREIGVNGMIGGQAADLSGIGSQSRMEKTTALTRLSMAAGAVAAGASSLDADVLISFGESLGEAYQVCDDLADVHCAEVKIGKTVGQDRAHGRVNVALEQGVHAASEHAQDLIHRASRRLRSSFGSHPAVDLLIEFAESIVERTAGLTQ